MRIALVLTSVLALAAPAMAGGDKAAEAKAKGKDTANTLTGCLSKTTPTTGTEAAYTLTTKNKEIDVRGGQLADHVGHEVKLTGTWMNEAAHGGCAPESVPPEKQTVRTDKGSPRHFMVSEIQHIAETCTTKLELKQEKHQTKQESQQEKHETKPQKQY